MAPRILVTGGAGFIGSHLVDLLLATGHPVRVLDNLDPQVHGPARVAKHLSRDAELMVADIRDADAVRRAVDGVDGVVHLAAAVGVGQSMYEIEACTQVNDVGAAILMEALTRHPVERLVCASSMSIYGEGSALRADGVCVDPGERTLDELRRGQWEPLDAAGNPLTPIATPEHKRPSLSSVYALNKYCQERLCLITGKAYGIPTLALRFFNVYGPRQALSNPYTGVLAIFAARLINERSPLVFEDGKQRRDFVHVQDVAQACALALKTERGIGEAFNIGSGESRTISNVAQELAGVMNRNIAPQITGRFRAGDIRHCFADIDKSREQLGYAPRVAFADGLRELAEWLAGQAADDAAERANAELERRGLVA